MSFSVLPLMLCTRYVQKNEVKISDEKTQEIKESFAHFDKDGDGGLDKAEFKAALSALSINFKDEAAYMKIFTERCRGGAKVYCLYYYLLRQQ
jgi:Ca2+-binding EF-hand superfamily protein